MIAIVVDDTGYDPANLDQWLSIDAPITFSVMPYCAYSSSLADRLADAGVPGHAARPDGQRKPEFYAGQGQLDVGMDRDTVFRTLDADLAQVPHVAGFNNHEGGLGCERPRPDDAGMPVGRGARPLRGRQQQLHPQQKCPQACVMSGCPAGSTRSSSTTRTSPTTSAQPCATSPTLPRRTAPPSASATSTAGGRDDRGTLKAEGIHFAFVRDVGN